MKKILFMMLAAMAIVGCESEYDKMSEYEKVVYEVGTNPNLSLEDVLKNTPIWTEAKVIRSSQPEGNGDVSVQDFEGEVIPAGGVRYYFVFGDKFRYYTTSTIGVGYQGYYVDYDYNIGKSNIIGLENGLNVEDYKVFGIAFDKINVVAYSENRIVIDLYDKLYAKQPYVTFVLKSNTQALKEKKEKYCTDIKTYEQALVELSQK